MAKKQKKNRPKERVRSGKISLLQWENSNGNGETFESFSINKTVTRTDDSDRSRFTGQILSLNGLTKRDLTDVKNVIALIEGKVLDLEDLQESG